MVTLGKKNKIKLVGGGAAWLWHNHGLRERALERVKQHCKNLDIELLDENVALKKIGLIPDANGHKRLARVYNFEFTVTGDQRHTGTITQFGAHSVKIELPPYPFQTEAEPSVIPSAQVIELSQWRQEHSKTRH